jgi:hypothetical protein
VKRAVPHLVWLLGTITFVAVFVGHALYLRYLASASQKVWADNFNPSASFWQTYLIGQDYFVSFSYALSAGFAVWATARFVYSRQRAAAVGAFGGVSLVTLLAAAGCFLIGCCGSPMLAVYISLFGSKAAGVGKPLMALISLISIGGGYLYVVRRSECHCTQDEVIGNRYSVGDRLPRLQTGSGIQNPEAGSRNAKRITDH